MRKSSHEMFCLHHPATVREKAGDFEHVEAGRRCESRVGLSIDGDHEIADVARVLESFAFAAGWRAGMCPKHRAVCSCDGLGIVGPISSARPCPICRPAGGTTPL